MNIDDILYKRSGKNFKLRILNSSNTVMRSLCDIIIVLFILFLFYSFYSAYFTISVILLCMLAVSYGEINFIYYTECLENYSLN